MARSNFYDKTEEAHWCDLRPQGTPRHDQMRSLEHRTLFWRVASPHAYAYWFSFIGNVLGTKGQMSGWTYEGTGSANNFPPEKSVWALGWMDITPQGNDPKVAATAIRNGNYDYLNNAQRYHTVPGGYPLPSSLYLSGKPAFFGSYQWPWVDPMTGTIYTLPAKARYDAGTPFVQP